MEKEKKALTEEQYQHLVAVLNEVERIRNLSPVEKEKIIRGLFEESPFIDLTCDWAFKHIFGHHPELLMMLLNDILPEKITRIEYDPNEIDRESPNDKNVIMDVFCHTEDGRRIVVEMQKEDRDSFLPRMLYYGASRLREQLEVGGDYNTLCPVYIVCFMDYTLPHYGIQVPPGKLIFTYRLMEEQTLEEYGRWLNIFLCELPRLKDAYDNNLTPQEQWFAIIRNLPNFARKKPLWLGGRYEPLLKLAQSKGLTSLEQVQYLRAMVSEREKEDIARAYLRRGREEGREEAERKEREKHRAEILQIAKNLLEYGLSPENVAHNTGLSPEELEPLKP